MNELVTALQDPGTPEVMLAAALQIDSDPALASAALDNPTCPPTLIVTALGHPDVTVRYDALRAIRDRGILAPAFSLQRAAQLGMTKRPSAYQTVMEFSPTLVPDLVRKPLDTQTAQEEMDSATDELAQSLDDDFLFSMSRSAQELFHSNSIGWLLEHVPAAGPRLMQLFGVESDPANRPQVWRELRHLDLVIDPGVGHTKVVLENKLFSIPGTEQLERYIETPVPWSKDHGSSGAPDTEYVLLSLMPPAFQLPWPWRHVGYHELARELDLVAGEVPDEDAALISRYVRLVNRLSDFAAMVDPRFRPLSQSFSDWHKESAFLTSGSFRGLVEKLRYTGLVQLIRDRANVGDGEFEVNLTHGTGLAGFRRNVAPTRIVGWQLQGQQLRLYVRLMDDGLFGRGSERKGARELVAAEEHQEWFNFSIAEHALGEKIRPRLIGAKTFLAFDPDFVYQTRKLDTSVTVDELSSVLADYTTRAMSAEEVGG